VKQALQVFSSRRVAAVLILVGVFVELVMSLGIRTGVADRLAAFIMAGYCAVTAVLFKRFCEPEISGKSARARDASCSGTS